MQERSGSGHCPCGATTFTISGEPLARFICHCTVCQAFNKGPSADVSVFRAHQIRDIDAASIVYRAYMRPALVQRGRCVRCDEATVEQVRLPLMPDLTIVPTANLPPELSVPEARFHAFYGRRVADVDDTLPKHAGFLSSQLAFGRALIAAMTRRAVT